MFVVNVVVVFVLRVVVGVVCVGGDVVAVMVVML